MESNNSILIKYLSQPLSADERDELLKWRALSSENQTLFSEASKLHLLNEYKNRNTVAETTLALSRIQRKIHRNKTRYSLRNIIKYAAVIVLTVGLSLFAWERLSAEKYTTIVVAENESVKKVHLADGTSIWLSESSELRIPKSFSADNRKVLIKGKAFFDVHKNPESPFLVSSSFLNVKVTGTSFDLFVDEDKKQVETILVSGKIILQDTDGKDVYGMSPGERVSYDSENNQFTIKTVDANTLTAWHLDQITFENATLREIVNKLSLIYDVNINLESKRLAERRYRYVINREETLKEVLDILSYLAPIKYRIEDNEVFIAE